MKLTLSVTASAATLAAILNLIDEEGLDVAVAAPAEDDDQIPLPLIPTATAHVAAPQLSDNGDRDSAGLPWDERIHASTKVKTSDGKWRQKRGVDKALVAQVETQLRAAAPMPPPVVEQPVPVAMPVMPPMPTPTLQPVAPTPPMPPVQPITPPPIPAMQQPVPMPPPVVEQPVAAQAAITFHDVMMKCQGVTPDYLTGICQQLTEAFQMQVNSITDIASNQMMIDYAAGCFSRDGNW